MNEAHLKQILLVHRGKERAITAKELAKIFDTDERFIRVQIRNLIGFPSYELIASTTEKPYGYFMAETIQEANECIETLLGRIKSDCVRLRDLKRAKAKRFSGQQIPLMVADS